MKKIILLPTLILLMTTAGCNKESANAATPPTEEKSKAPETVQQKQAYSVGSRMAQSHKQVIDDVTKVQGEFDVDMYMMGIQDTINGELKFTAEELKSISDNFRKEYLEKKREIVKKEKDEAKKVADEFLAANKEKPGVITTDSGLQYKVITTGDGKKPVKGDTVKVLYTGKLINGEVFDTTSPGNQPRDFPLNRVVRGWSEGLKLMNVGSKFEFYIPPKLGYGSRDTEEIPAGSVLIFEVELVDTFTPDPKDKKDGPRKPKLPAGHP